MTGVPEKDRCQPVTKTSRHPRGQEPAMCALVKGRSVGWRTQTAPKVSKAAAALAACRCRPPPTSVRLPTPPGCSGASPHLRFVRTQRRAGFQDRRFGPARMPGDVQRVQHPRESDLPGRLPAIGQALFCPRWARPNRQAVLNQVARRTIISLIFPMAAAGSRFFGHTSTQFKMVRQRNKR